jgi:serine/threonine protein kinase
MGEVWAARDDGLDRPVAIKIVLAHLDNDPALIDRLRREARIAGALQHPGITVVHYSGDHDGRPYFVMELLDGRDFTALLAEHPGGLPAEVAVGLMIQVAGALAYAHRQGVVHRDIKPANLMCLAGGGVKICDFGIARYAEASTRTAAGGRLGTPAFMAPEQWRGEQAGTATDLYSFGATLHALLVGEPPFPGPSDAALMYQHLDSKPPCLRALRPGLPAELDDLLQHLLAKKPGDRPATATQVEDALRAILDRLVTSSESTVDTGSRRRPLSYRLTNSRWDMIERAGRPAGRPGRFLAPRRAGSGDRGVRSRRPTRQGSLMVCQRVGGTRRARGDRSGPRGSGRARDGVVRQARRPRPGQ